MPLEITSSMSRKDALGNYDQMNAIQKKAEPIWERWLKGEITDKEATRLFIEAGVPQQEVHEAMFIAKGGRDIVGESGSNAQQ